VERRWGKEVGEGGSLKNDFTAVYHLYRLFSVERDGGEKKKLEHAIKTQRVN
jgi:hypothetical protein